MQFQPTPEPTQESARATSVFLFLFRDELTWKSDVFWVKKPGMKFVFRGSIGGSNAETLGILFDCDAEWTTFTFGEGCLCCRPMRLLSAIHSLSFFVRIDERILTVRVTFLASEHSAKASTMLANKATVGATCMQTIACNRGSGLMGCHLQVS
jgi:hypothetical protein